MVVNHFVLSQGTVSHSCHCHCLYLSEPLNKLPGFCQYLISHLSSHTGNRCRCLSENTAHPSNRKRNKIKKSFLVAMWSVAPLSTFWIGSICLTFGEMRFFLSISLNGFDFDQAFRYSKLLKLGSNPKDTSAVFTRHYSCFHSISCAILIFGNTGVDLFVPEINLRSPSGAIVVVHILQNL